MLLGALLHAGLDQQLLQAELAKLQLPDARITIESTSRQSIAAVKVAISDARRQELRTLPAIRQILDASHLAEPIRLRSLAVFQALAEAEARVHGIALEQVHFHEIGALDTIFDVVGTVIGLHHLGVSRLVCSPLPMGRGFVQCAHGLLPLPAPATCELLKDLPTYGVEIDKELVTPTGAALLAVLADSFGPMPPMAVTATGYGAGSHVLPHNQPNLLRLLLGKATDAPEAQLVSVLETRLDDWNPESFPYLCELLLGLGAVDANLTSCLGKKGRPGFQLQVICRPADSVILQNAILSETTAIGLRIRQEPRRTLPREQVQMPTPWGSIAAKRVVTPRGAVVYPEYEACRTMAQSHGVTIDAVYRAVYAAAGNRP